VTNNGTFVPRCGFCVEGGVAIVSYGRRERGLKVPT
jgi:hypothetical protein